MKNYHRVHFVGIGGIGMSALAQHLVVKGCKVSGSDQNKSRQTQKLQNLGVKIFVGHAAQNVGDAQLVVRTSAVSEDNSEVAFAKKAGIPVVLREQLLGEIFNQFSLRIAVCGTHGKTTATAWIHFVLERCGISHTAFIGGEYNGQNYFCGDGVVVAEACEYNRSFLWMRPTLCVCLNAEWDHPDCYANEQILLYAFGELFSQSQVVACFCPQKFDAKFLPLPVVEGVRMQNGKASFLLKEEDFCNKIDLSVCGRHNVQNALAAFVVARYLRLPLLTATQAIGRFGGVDRRWTKCNCRIPVVCDYAHHPTEIRAAVATAQSVCKGKIYCVFQPHTYSRTQALMGQFAECFQGIHEVCYLPIFAARERPIKGVSSFALFRLAKQQGQNARYFANFESVAKHLLSVAGQNDLVLLLGAGNVNEIAQLLC